MVVQRAFILRRTRYRGGPGTARNARSRLQASRGRKRLRALRPRARGMHHVLRPTSTTGASTARARIHYYCHRKAKLSPMRW